jgi:fibronectin-binding autotransporter adhesin
VAVSVGGGTWALGGLSTFTGTTTVAGGTLSASNLADGGMASSVGKSSNAAANLLLGNGSTLQYTGAATSSNRGFTINGTAAAQGATLDASGTGALNLTNTASPAYGTAAQTRTLTLTGSNTGANTLAANIANNTTGAVSLVKSGAGTWVLSGTTSAYSGGTSVTAGQLLVTNATGSATGTGAVGVTGSTAVLGGTGHVSGAVTLTSGGTVYSGAVAAGTGAPATGVGAGITLGSALNVNGGNLTFALNNGTTSPPASYSSPNMTTSFMTVTGNTTGEISFTGTDTVTLVDLTSGGLTLRMNAPYLLIQAGSTPGLLADDALYYGLVTMGSDGTISMDGNGYVLGVYKGTGDFTNPANYTAITFNEFGADGVTPLTNAGANGRDVSYLTPSLYLYNGELEVVPEPGTWALMIGGLALLIVIQRRRNKVG